MKAWGQVGGTRLADVGPERSEREKATRYAGSDWWRDCGTDEALARHERRGQHPCKICLEGRRRREQERREAETGVPIVYEALLRQLAALNRPRSTGEAIERRHADCGTTPAIRRHRRYGETGETCGVLNGRSATRTRLREGAQ